MRIALLFSGQPRVVDGIVFKSIQEVFLSKYDVDVYAHFWDYVDSSKANASASDSIRKFKDQYSPKAIAVDPPLREDEYPASASSSWPRNSYSMYASFKRVYTLFEATRNEIDYDWIIRIRIDSVLFRVPDLRTLENGRIYVPKWHGDSPVIVNHTIIIAPELAKTFFSIQDSFEELNGSIDEEYMYSHFKLNNLLPFLSPLSMDVFYPAFSRDGITTQDPPPNGEYIYKVTKNGPEIYKERPKPLVQKTPPKPITLLTRLIRKAWDENT